MTQFANYSQWDKPLYEKIYKLSKIIRFGTKKSKNNFICDIDGNFNLMCSNQKALRLLAYIKKCNTVNITKGE